MELGLNDFLSELGRDTVSRLNRETRSKTIQPVQQAKEERVVEMPRHQAKIDPEPEQHTINEEQLDEDFIETAIDYSNVVLKTIRSTFESKLERRKVMESIRSAIDLYLGETTQKQSSFFAPRQDFIPRPNNESVVMNDLTGQEVKVKPQAPKGIMENKLNISVTHGPDGKPVADLSKLSDNDIASLRVLSGIDELK